MLGSPTSLQLGVGGPGLHRFRAITWDTCTQVAMGLRLHLCLWTRCALHDLGRPELECYRFSIRGIQAHTAFCRVPKLGVPKLGVGWVPDMRGGVAAHLG